METPSHRAQFPRPFGPRYVLLKELAHGGMGTIFLALGGGRVCAVKTLLANEADIGVANRFLDEARLATQLSHPNLVYVSEAGSEEDTAYFTMEYVRGKNLHEVFRRCGERRKHVPLGLALFITKELLRGLAYLHRVEGLNLVHRDLAPSNIILSYEGGLKIVDLGLAKWRDRLSQTMLGNGDLGQSRYVSPEQRRGRPVDARSDIFSVGVILWEMLTGRALSRELADRPLVIQPPSQVVSTLPKQVDQLVMGALTEDPIDRFQSAQEAMAALTPHMSAEHEGTALQSFLADLFEGEIRQEADDEKKLVALARDAALLSDFPAAEASVKPKGWARQSTPGTGRPQGHARRRYLLVAGMVLGLATIGTWLALRSRPAGEKRAELVPTVPVGRPENSVDAGTGPGIPAASEPAPSLSAAPPPPPQRRVARPSSSQLLEKAEARYRSQRFTEAINIAEGVLKTGGENLEARLLLGKIYLQMEMYKEALAQYEDALKLSPKETAALRGRDLARTGKR